MYRVCWTMGCLVCSLCLSCVVTANNTTRASKTTTTTATTGTTTRQDSTLQSNSTEPQTSSSTEITTQPGPSSTLTRANKITTAITAITTTTNSRDGRQSVWRTINQFFANPLYLGITGGIIIIIVIIIVVCIARRCRRRPPSAETEDKRLRPWNWNKRFSIIRPPIRVSKIITTDFDVKSDVIPATKKADLPPVSPKGDKVQNGACEESQLYAVPMRRRSEPTSPSPRSSCLRLYYQSSPFAAGAAPALGDLPPPPPSPPPLVPAKGRPPSVTYNIPSNIPAVPKKGLPPVRSAVNMQSMSPSGSGPGNVPQLPKGGSREQRGRSLLFSW